MSKLRSIFSCIFLFHKFFLWGSSFPNFWFPHKGWKSQKLINILQKDINSILCTKGEKRDFINKCEFSVRAAGECEAGAGDEYWKHTSRCALSPVAHTLFFITHVWFQTFFGIFKSSGFLEWKNRQYFQCLNIYPYP